MPGGNKLDKKAFIGILLNWQFRNSTAQERGRRYIKPISVPIADDHPFISARLAANVRVRYGDTKVSFYSSNMMPVRTYKGKNKDYH